MQSYELQTTEMSAGELWTEFHPWEKFSCAQTKVINSWLGTNENNQWSNGDKDMLQL